MRKTSILISVALLLFSWSATAGIPRTAAQQRLMKQAAAEPLRSTAVGVFAMTMSGDTIVDYNRSVKLIPASNMKLITTGIALRLLGADYKYGTSIAYTGRIEGGTLKGDLYIVGGGDPTTAANVDCADPVGTLFSKWAKFVSDAGITKIEGRIIGDQRYFDDPMPVNASWNYEDLGTYYGAGPAGLNFYENSQHFYVTPGPGVGSTPNITAKYPDTPWMKYVNTATTGKSSSSNTLSYAPSNFSAEGQFWGSFPIDRKGYTLECSNRNGAYTCAYYFWKYLKSHNISSDGFADINLLGCIRTEPGTNQMGALAADSKDMTVLGTTYSAPLSKIISETNHQSDNFFAATLLRTIGLKTSGSCRYEASVAAEEKALKAMGVSVSGAAQIVDGNGLSRKNYVSPEFFVRYLKAYAGTKDYSVFLASLPVPGQKGTISSKFPNTSTDYKNRFHFKSGSMNGVRCYSGYILSADGDPSHTIVFSLMMNSLTVSSWAINPYIDGIIESIAAEN